MGEEKGKRESTAPQKGGEMVRQNDDHQERVDRKAVVNSGEVVGLGWEVVGLDGEVVDDLQYRATRRRKVPEKGGRRSEDGCDAGLGEKGVYILDWRRDRHGEDSCSL